MRARLTLLLPALAIVLASCTQDSGGGVPLPPGGQAERSAPSDVLLLGTDQGALSLSLPTGSLLFDGIGAVAAPDGSLLYSAANEGRSTLLTTTRTATGGVVATTRVRGQLDVRVVSQSGRAAALMQPLPEGVDAWTPVPRRETTILVADPTGVGEPRRYQLRGNFEPEAFSATDSMLFLIQHLPALAPIVYRVTALNLENGTVAPVGGRYKSPPERMAGTRLEQVGDFNGAQLYTLYSSRPAYGSVAHSDGDMDLESFVHVLNLRNGWAYCADLPKVLWDRPGSVQAMAEGPGNLLYVLDSGRSVVAVMNTRTLELVRTVRVRAGLRTGIDTSAVVSPDGRTLFVGSARGVDVLDTATLQLVHRWPTEGAVSALGMSRDGHRLFLVLNDRIAVVDPDTGRELRTVQFSGLGSVSAVQAAA